LSISYAEFIARKTISHTPTGFDAPQIDGFGWIYPFQKFVARKGIRRGRNAVFGGTGTGKTRLEIATSLVCAGKTQKPSIIVTQLGVAGQIVEEAVSVGVDACRWGDGSAPVQVINFDMMHKLDPTRFGCFSIDESACIKDEESRRKKLLCELTAGVDYVHAFSAVPSPNRPDELGSHAELLRVMSKQAMLARWYVHDSEKTSDWRLKGHALDDYYRWVASWSITYRVPSDLGDFSDEGYILPPLHLRREIVQTEDNLWPGVLISDSRLSSTTIHAEMRKTAKDRAAAVARLVASEPDESWMIWCDSDNDADELLAAMPGFVEVRGSMKDTIKESRLLGFGHGEIKHLITKPAIAAHGLNWQVCTRTAFVGPSFSFERVYQAIRRFWRFGQTKDVHAWIFSADSEWNVLESFDIKMKQYEEETDRMIDAMKSGELANQEKPTRPDFVTDDCTLLFGDNVVRIADVPDEAVGYIATSPPFASLMTYSDDAEDMGNCANDDEFFDHMRYLVPELHRVLMPGRLVSMHCMDLPSTKERDGVIGLRDFPGELIRLFESCGFVFHSRVTIWKDPLVAMQRTKAIGLLHKQLCKDSAMSRQGIADYFITMRKLGTNPEPISHGTGFDRYIGESGPTAQRTDDAATNKYGHEVWQRYASPVWMDIDQGKVLPYRGARESKDERHVCPLQLQVIERGIELWSNPGDLVMDPFNGVGSVGYVAIQNGRKYVGLELKASYFDQAILNLNRAKGSIQPDLFGEPGPDFVGVEYVKADDPSHMDNMGAGVW